jgi:hypothetical protein
MKRLLIPVILVFIYVFFIDIVSQMSFPVESSEIQGVGGSGQVVGFGQAVSISVTRPYLFGLFYLPTYSDSLGYIGGWHDAFFSFVIVLAIALLLLEFKNRKEIKGRKTKSRSR